MEIEFFDPPQRGASEKLRLASEKERIGKMEKGSYTKFGYDYFDNDKLGIGYGGYKYDGRYEKTAKRMAGHYGLKEGSRVLEIGCSKGFLLVEFLKMGMEANGVDLSEYAISNCHPQVKGKAAVCDVTKGLPFPDKYFDFIVSKEVLPHLDKGKIGFVFSEMQRCSRNGRMFHEIQTGRTGGELDGMRKWDITHQIYWTPEEWLSFFKKANYTGDWHFKVLVEE